MLTIRKIALVLGGLAAGLCNERAIAETVTLFAVRDNTLYETPDGSISNGSGEHMFAGRSGQGNVRRGVIAFATAEAIPAGASIQSVALHLFMSRTSSEAFDFSIHRLSTSWGEGTSDAEAGEGVGAFAEPNDATWLHRFYSATLWSTPGGDYDSQPLATQSVNLEGWYAWGSTPGLVDCVQSWVDNPASDHGWILIGDETQASAKRFDSRQIIATDTAPRLVIEFTPAACPGDLNSDGSIGLADLAILLSEFGNAIPGAVADIDQDGEVGLTDLTVLLSQFGSACAP